MSIQTHHNRPENDHQSIAKLEPANSKEFGRILKLINSEQTNCPIAIRNSVICQNIMSEHYIIEIDLNKLIGNNVNMTPLFLEGQGKDVINLLSSGESNIFFDTDEKEYVFQNSYRSERLPFFEVSEEAFVQPLVFSANDCLGVQVSIDDMKDMKKYISKSDCCALLIYNGQLEQAISFNKLAPYNFKKASVGNLKYESPEMILLSYNFLKFSDKDTKLQLAAIDGKGFWLITEVKMTSKSTIKTYELLTEYNA